MYTTDHDGLLNNFAVEPKLYYATYPSPQQQRRYAFQAVLATVVVVLAVFTALSVS